MGEGLHATSSLMGDPQLRRRPVAGPTRVGSDFSSPDSWNGRKKLSSFLCAFTWPQSPKGLIWPLFTGAWVAEEPPPNCLAAGNNGAIVGGVECGQAAGTASAPRAGPHPKPACPAALCSLPPGTARQTDPPSLAWPAWPEPLAPAAPGWPLSSAYTDVQTAIAMTLQEAGACGPGPGGGGGDETGCMPVILLQGRQEGQTGFLVSVLAPSGKKGLGDCERQAGSPVPWASFPIPSP